MRFKCFLGPRAIFYCNIHNQIENVRNPSKKMCPHDRERAGDMEEEREGRLLVHQESRNQIRIQKTLMPVSSIQLNTNNSNATPTQHAVPAVAALADVSAVAVPAGSCASTMTRNRRRANKNRLFDSP
jgi:hypothetical protein